MESSIPPYLSYRKDGTHTAFEYASASIKNDPPAYNPRDDIDRYLAYDDIEDASDRSTFIPLTLPEPQGVYPHPQYKPITPSRVLKWPMCDPFVGAGESKPSPTFTPRRQAPHEQS